MSVADGCAHADLLELCVVDHAKERLDKEERDDDNAENRVGVVEELGVVSLKISTFKRENTYQACQLCKLNTKS